MAPLSPRRSSRARATLPPTQSHQSSVSSGASSGRPDRNTRSLQKPASDKSTPSASLSSEPLDDPDDTLLGRRRRRVLDDETDNTPRLETAGMANADEDLPDEEDEAVRCICGSEDYPGPPPADAPEADFFLAHELTEDVTGFFVQCDICKVWQHGACVGIFSAESSPDEYFCELCRKDFHNIHTANNGSKYSKYLPLHYESRNTSRATSAAKEGTRSPRSGGSKSRPTSASLSAKRRSTMNSRDAAYDDDQLRRAIEASKEENASDLPEGTLRRTKRGRSDSERLVVAHVMSPEFDANRTPSNISAVKRQRTSSRSVSPPAETTEQPEPPQPAEESDDDSNTRTGVKKSRNGRAQRERPDKDDKEKLRQEAANKRKGRAERRRNEDSETSEELPLATSSAKPEPKASEPPTTASEPPVAKPPTPGTPPTGQNSTMNSQKRTVRSTHKKGKGKNQYTKDRDLELGGSPARSMSRDIQQKNEDATSAGPVKPPFESKHMARAKAAGASKMSMLDMKRRVAAIMEFISRTQVDLAAEGSIQSGESSNGQSTPINETATRSNGPSDKESDGETDKEFKDLNCVAMMDVLTRDMVKWQNTYT